MFVEFQHNGIAHFTIFNVSNHCCFIEKLLIDSHFFQKMTSHKKTQEIVSTDFSGKKKQSAFNSSS